MTRKNISKATFLIGIIIFLINIFGFFVPLKNPAIYNEEKNKFENDTILSPQETFNLLQTLNKNDKKQYVSDVNNIFNKSIAHYWEDNEIDKYNMAIPFYKNKKKPWLEKK